MSKIKFQSFERTDNSNTLNILWNAEKGISVMFLCYYKLDTKFKDTKK